MSVESQRLKLSDTSSTSQPSPLWILFTILGSLGQVSRILSCILVPVIWSTSSGQSLNCLSTPTEGVNCTLMRLNPANLGRLKGTVTLTSMDPIRQSTSSVSHPAKHLLSKVTGSALELISSLYV